MAKFRFRAKDSQGQLQQGVQDAADANAMADMLLRKQWIPLSIEPMAERQALQWQRLLLAKPGLEDMIIFSRQMYSLVKAGIPIIRAIQGLAQSAHNQLFREVLLDVRSQLEQGRSLAASMATHKAIFNQLTIAIVHVGENTGALEASFLQLSEYFEREQETRKRIKAAMRYPMLVIAAIAVAMVILNIFVIPTFANMFAKFHAELPWATKVLLATSAFFVKFWWLLLLVMVVAGFAIVRFINTPNGRLWWDKIKLRIPIVGSILERSLLARYARSFAMILKAGVPMTAGLSLVAEAVDNRHMERQIIEMRRSIERGESFYRVSVQSKLFTPLVLQMVAVGEETGQVDSLLEEAAEYYEREVDYDLKSLTAKIEPILIAIVAGMVLILALGIFTPMWDMMNAYKGRK